jgi:acetoin:2,6-dichlorophenolindophenol oxidoreductase subunit alpha
MTAMFERDTALRVAERMLNIRRFEERVIGLWERKAFTALYHLYIGQEAGGAGVLEALGSDDLLLSNHRNHGHVIGRGADPARAYAEILGRATGLTGGRGGSVHLCDPSLGFLPTVAILGGNISLALGAAFAIKRRRQNRVVAVFFGDGSLEEGVTYEVMNIAALQKLPILFILENNNAGSLAIHEGGFSAANTSLNQFLRIPEIFDIEARQLADGNDVAAIVATTREAVDRCHAGHGPVFLEIMSVRWPGSNRIWPELLTGPLDLRMAWGECPGGGEYTAWFEGQDPVLRFARDVLAARIMSQAELLQIDADVCARMEAAERFAIDSPWPTPKSAFDHVFA